MSEEEIIKMLQEIIQKNQQVIKEAYKNKDINTMQLVADIDNEAIAIQGLLDLYNKEKMNSSNLSEQLNKEKEKNKKAIEYINKNCSTNNCDFMDDGVGNLFKDILELLEERN